MSNYCQFIVVRLSHSPQIVETLIKIRLTQLWFVISDFRRDADEICALLGCYAAPNGNPLPTFRGNLSVTSPRVKYLRPLKTGPIGCPETSVKDYHSTLRNTQEERRSHNFGYLFLSFRWSAIGYMFRPFMRSSGHDFTRKIVEAGDWNVYAKIEASAFYIKLF
jgi:hypothetical protein